VANVAFNRGKKGVKDGSILLLTDVIKLALGVGATYVVNADHDFANNGGAQSQAPLHASNEASGTNYVQGFAGAGRKTLAGKAITEDDANDYAKFTATNITFTAINGFTATYGILYKHLTSDAASELLYYFDSGFPFTANGGDVNLNWDATHGVSTLA
jgi:hypothetical protein